MWSMTTEQRTQVAQPVRLPADDEKADEHTHK